MQGNKVDFPMSYDAYAENCRRRILLRRRNFEERDDDFGAKQRKSAQIKVIQKFIGKLKTEPKNYEALLTELDALNLAKYVDEISNIISGSVQDKQISFYAEVSTKLHSEYENVPSILIKDLTKAFNQAFEANDDPKNRLKSLFLFTVELFVCGFSFSYKEVLQMIKKVFKGGKSKRLAHPSELQGKLFFYWFNSNIFTTFVAQFSQIFTKKTPIWINKWKQEGKQIFKLQQVLPARAKEQLTIFFTRYISECLDVLKESKDKIHDYEKSLFENLKMDGDFNKELEKNYIDLIQKFITTKKNFMEILSSLGENPQIEDLDFKIASVEQIKAKYINKVDDAEIFQDEFQKQIYQKIPDLITNEDKNSGEQAYKQFKPKLDNCKNVNDCNQICRAFNQINNKKNRKYLVRDSLQYRKQYHLVTPYLCRVIAIANINYKDIGDLVNEMIFQEYEKVKDASANIFVINDKKSRFLKYICQFTKFGVVDPDRTMNCIEHLIQNLNGYNIELIVAVLENVGRFLNLSHNSARRFTFLMNKYENVIKKKSLPIFTTSQLINSINLLKPHKEAEQVQQKEKTGYEVKAEKAMSLCVIEDTDSMEREIDELMKSQEGFEALKVAFLKAIERFDFINSYNYAYLLESLRYDKLSNFIVDRTIQNLFLCLVSGENQKTILWAKFFAELYKYNLLERPLLYSTVEKMFTVKNNEIGVISSTCNLLSACQGYLDSKKPTKQNQRFMLFANFKRYLEKCSYITMLQQFQILEIFEIFEPDLAELPLKTLEEFLAAADKTMQSQGKQLSYPKELDKFLSQNNLKKKQQKVGTKDDRNRDGSDNSKGGKSKEKKSSEITNADLLQEKKAFDLEFNNILQNNRKDYSSRIAKPVFLEKVFDKKKEKKKEGPCITIIGRSGNKFIKKDVAKGGSAKQ